MAKIGMVGLLFFGLSCLCNVQAEQVPHDPNLPTVKPEVLEQLSDTRVRQQIIQESQAKYRGRCVCPYQTRDASGRSCKGRHEIVRSDPQPSCRPEQVTPRMMDEWRKHAK
jgi:hypothetical protein